MVPLNRWILAELPGTKMIGLIGGFFDPFGNSKGLLCEEKSLVKKRMSCRNSFFNMFPLYHF